MKKVIYILNLLFLTLLTFGGSVFAAGGDPPKQYIDADGSVEDVPISIKSLYDVANNSDNNTLSDEWYYINQAISKPKNSIGVASGKNVNIVVAAGNQSISFTSGAFFVPEGATLNFWAESNSGTDNNVNLQISNSSNAKANFVIGNDQKWSNVVFQYTTSDFGDITFNSGTYTVTNNFKTSPGPAIGSDTDSGGTFTINQEAKVYPNVNGGGTAVGTPADDQNCTVSIAGGLLDCSGGGIYAYGINVGTSGQVNVSNQGKILSSTNLTELKNWTIADSGGIVAYPTVQEYPVKQNQWSVLVGGSVTLPVFGNYPQNLDPPAGSDYWNSVTINPGAELTLGAGNQNGNPQAALFLVGGNTPVNSVVNNNGTVIINSVNQIKPSGGAAYPVSWNNNPGSTLTINSDATLSIWTNGFNNSATAQITIEGTLYVSNGGTFQNNGNLNIAEGGMLSGLNQNLSQVIGTAGVVNNPKGTVTLDGTVTLTQAADFENSGTLDIGPIGTVNGNLTNVGATVTTPGGTVTSQNTCYYGIKFIPLLSSL